MVSTLSSPTTRMSPRPASLTPLSRGPRLAPSPPVRVVHCRAAAQRVAAVRTIRGEQRQMSWAAPCVTARTRSGTGCEVIGAAADRYWSRRLSGAEHGGSRGLGIVLREPAWVVEHAGRVAYCRCRGGVASIRCCHDAKFTARAQPVLATVPVEVTVPLGSDGLWVGWWRLGLLAGCSPVPCTWARGRLR